MNNCRPIAAIFFNLLFCSASNAAPALEEGMCIGAVSMALKMGVKASDYSTQVIQQVKRIADKYKGVESQWSSVADGCFVIGAPMSQTYSCMENRIKDINAFNYYKGVFAARNSIASKQLAVAQYNSSAVCVVLTN